MSTIDHDEADEQLAEKRRQLWNDLSSSTRTQYAFPQPGERRSRADEEEDARNFNPEVPDENNPLDVFSVLLIQAHHVDFLDLRENQRIFFKRDEQGNWYEMEVNP